jgi:hypothetical protein
VIDKKKEEEMALNAALLLFSSPTGKGISNACI